MKLSFLGELSIECRPDARPDVMNVKIACQNRKEVLVAQTRPDETTDQFCQRLKSMLRALIQGEERIPTIEKGMEKKKEKTWAQQKAEFRNASSTHPVPQQPPSQP